MNTHDKIELPPLPEPDAEFGTHSRRQIREYTRAAIEADRKRIATALESRFIVSDSKANVSHPDYQYYVGAADAYDIAEQIVKGELDE